MTTQKCAGPGCQCEVGVALGDGYCSALCRLTTSEMTGPCLCGHLTCTAEAPAEP